MSSLLIPIEDMHADSRRYFHTRFPYYASNDVCLYINSITGESCGAPSVRNEEGLMTCACQSHMADFRLGLMIRMWVVDHQSEIDEEETIDDIPMYIEPASECAVCLESVDLLSLPCRHVACMSCYNKLQTKKCPMCRCDIVHSFVRRLPK